MSLGRGLHETRRLRVTAFGIQKNAPYQCVNGLVSPVVEVCSSKSEVSHLKAPWNVRQAQSLPHIVERAIAVHPLEFAEFHPQLLHASLRAVWKEYTPEI